MPSFLRRGGAFFLSGAVTGASSLALLSSASSPNNPCGEESTDGASLVNSITPTAHAHCQIPCGIYDDARRFTGMKEDAHTIGKATKEIIRFTDMGMRANRAHDVAFCAQQQTRWVGTKEAHASQIIETVSTYFLTQKVSGHYRGSTSAYDAIATNGPPPTSLSRRLLSRLILQNPPVRHHCFLPYLFLSLFVLLLQLKPKTRGQDGYFQYLESLAAHHRVLRAAMVAKQRCDDDAVAGLDRAIDELIKEYNP